MLNMWTWGVVVALSTFGSEPINVIAVPSPRLTPAAILPLGTAPSGGAVSDGTTFPQTDFEMETIAGVSNLGGASLRASGQPAAAVTLTTTTATPGIPGTTARFFTSDGTNAFGANEPYVLGSSETVAAVLSGNGLQLPDVTATPDGVVYVAYETRVTGNGAARVRARSPTTELWGSVQIPWGGDSPSIASGSGGYVIDSAINYRAARTDSGYALVHSGWFATSSTSMYLRIAVSLDKGTTWDTYASDLVLTFGASPTYTQANVVWDALGKQWVLTVLRTTTGPVYSLRTYVSDDPTMAHWVELAGAPIAAVTQSALVHACGVSYLATLEGSTSVAIRRRDATSTDWTSIKADTGGNFDAAHGLILVVNDSGWLYLIGRASADANLWIMQVSTNDGYTWGDPSQPYPHRDGAAMTFVDDGGSTTSLTNGPTLQAGAWTTEGAWLVGGLITSDTTTDASIMAYPLGGISNITSDAAPSATEPPWSAGTIPTTKSSLYTFTASAGAAATDVIDSGGRLVRRIDATVSSGFYTYTPTGSPTVHGGTATFGPDGGGVIGTMGIAAGAHNVAGSASYSVVLYLSSTAGTIRGWDTGAGAYLHTALPYDVTLPIDLRLVVDGTTGKAAGYYRQPGATAWSTAFVNTALTSLGAGTVSLLDAGKIGATDAAVDLLNITPIGSAAGEFAADLVLGLTSSTRVPIRATGRPQRHPQGLHLWFHGSPLHRGDTFTARTISRSPLAYLSPLRPAASPSSQYIGATGSSGSTYRVVYDSGASNEWWLATGLSAVMWANLGPVASVALRRWDGAAWQTEFSVAGYGNPLGADGSVGFTRDSGTSLTFRPNGANGQPQYIGHGAWNGRWVQIGDGTYTILAKIRQTFPGQFGTTTGGLRAGFEIDQSTIVAVAGPFVNLSTSTTVGNFRLYHDDGVGLGTVTIATVRYYAIQVALAPGATIPTGGLLTAGPAYYLTRPPRDGSSIRYISADDIRQLANGLVQGQKVRRRGQRVIELPFDSMLLQPGYYAAGATIGGRSVAGSTARAALDDNLFTVEGVQQEVGQTTPVWLVQGAVASADPSSTPAVYGGRQVMCATMERQVDRTAARDVLDGRGIHAVQGGRLLLAERV